MKIRFTAEVSAPPNLSIREGLDFVRDVDLSDGKILGVELLEE